MEGAENRPEVVINYLVKSAATARNIASAAGFFSLLWSTVVLLGGFVSVLTIKDFWSLSVLSLLMASQLILMEMKTVTSWDYLADMHILRLSKGQKYQFKGGSRWLHFWTIFFVFTGLVLKIIVAIGIALPILFIGPYMTLALPVARLVQRDYGDAGGDAANKAKLDAAMIIFYVLVLFQSLSVFLCILVQGAEQKMFVSTNSGFGVWGPKIVQRYRSKTKDKYRKDGFLPDDWNLITFSVGLLESATWADHIDGARGLDTLAIQGINIRGELLSSSQAIQSLFDMIIVPTRTDGTEIRERAARIVADLARELRIAQFSDVLRCIWCLLESCNKYSAPEVSHPSGNFEQTLDKTARKVSIETFEHGHHQEDAHLSLAITEQTDHKQVVNLASDKSPKRRSTRTKRNRNEHHYPYVPKGTKEMISQGLVILKRLTQDEENCVEIIRHQRLLSKIILPLNHQDFLRNGCDHTWVDMLSSSLTVLSRLIKAGPAEDTTRLRHDMSRNTVAIHNLLSILEVDCKSAFSELRGQAIESLAELATVDSFRKLAFDESAGMKEMFAKRLLCIFLEDRIGNDVVAEEDEEKHKKVRRKAGEALARLLRVPSALTSAANANDVDLLPNRDMINLLTMVVNQILLCSKGEKAEDVVMLDGSSNSFHVEMVVESQPPNGVDTSQPSTQEDDEQVEERKTAICNKNVISGDDFTRAREEAQGDSRNEQECND